MIEATLAEGDKALFYYGFTDGIVGWEFNAFDATGYTTFTMDIYPTANGTLDFGPLGQGGADYAKTGVAVTANQWNTITIDLTGKDLTKIFQVKMYFQVFSFKEKSKKKHSRWVVEITQHLQLWWGTS